MCISTRFYQRCLYLVFMAFKYHYVVFVCEQSDNVYKFINYHISLCCWISDIEMNDLFYSPCFVSLAIEIIHSYKNIIKYCDPLRVELMIDIIKTIIGNYKLDDESFARFVFIIKENIQQQDITELLSSLHI